MAVDPYMTPGSAVADQLQNILARKALDARQSQQDALVAQNVQSQIRDRDASAQFNQARVAALNADRQAQEVNRHLETYSPGQVMTGSDLDYVRQNRPSLIDPGQPAQPQFDYEGQEDLPATGPTFHGLPAQLEKKQAHDEKMAALRVMDNPTAFAKLTPIQKAQVYHTATGGSLPEKLANPEGAEEKWKPVYDSEGNDTGNWAPQGTIFLRHEPKPPVDHGTYVGPVELPDPNDPTKTITKIAVMVNGHMQYQDLPSGGKLLHRPGPDKPVKPIPDYDTKALDKYLAAASNKKSTPTTLKGLMTDFINKIVDPDVQADVREAITSKDLGTKKIAELEPILTGSDAHRQLVLKILGTLGRQ